MTVVGVFGWVVYGLVGVGWDFGCGSEELIGLLLFIEGFWLVADL
jgi:hypothetical protein